MKFGILQKELAESHEIMTFVNPEFENYVENSIINHLDENTKIQSIENRGLIFEPHLNHNSSTCTNVEGRFNINFNYF